MLNCNYPILETWTERVDCQNCTTPQEVEMRGLRGSYSDSYAICQCCGEPAHTEHYHSGRIQEIDAEIAEHEEMKEEAQRGIEEQEESIDEADREIKKLQKERLTLLPPHRKVGKGKLFAKAA